MVERVVTDLRMSNPGRTIRFAVSGKGLRTKGDELWTTQIVTNLLSNALKYAPAEEMEKVFERFRRLGDHMTRTTGGSGLGLSIAGQLAHAVGGTVAVRGTPGGGATFTLILPSA